MAVDLVFELLPKQEAFVRASEREVLYAGAFGAGKTRALCMKLFLRALTPGARELVCRKHNVTLKRTTLKTLLEPDGRVPPVLPPGLYEHRRTDQAIRIRGGGEIVYCGLDAPEKIGSFNLSGVAVDEAVELTEADWTMLRGRLRLSVAGLARQLYGACNPGPPSHFLARRFGLAAGTRAAAGCRAIVTRTADNRFLPADYLADLDRFAGLAHRRYVLGQWVGGVGLVYDRWDREHFVADRPGPWRRIVVGVDEGYTNPSVLLAVAADGDGRAHVVREFYAQRVLRGDLAAEATRWAAELAPEAFVVDPAAAGLVAELRNRGLFVVEADHAVFDGIQAVHARLAPAGDGRPRLTVAPGCRETIREFESYAWVPGADRPRAENDHAMDALRYAIRYLDRPGGSLWVL